MKPGPTPTQDGYEAPEQRHPTGPRGCEKDGPNLEVVGFTAAQQLVDQHGGDGGH